MSAVQVVTGGASGIGAACARELARTGTVAVVDINRAAAEAVAREIGGHPFAADVGDEASVEA